jgi:scyllo-inositol 2-dehydrogenase (NADP+)
VADLPAIITLHRGDRNVVSVPLESLPAYGFHLSLVSYLLQGKPMEVTTEQSRDVVAIMQAAEESARANGRPVTPQMLRSTSSLGSVG